MINEAPKPDLKQKVATTKGPGQTLKNFRLSQKDSQDAQDRAKKKAASAFTSQTTNTGPLAVKPGDYNKQNYKATMAKRKAAQKKAAASAAQKTKAVSTGQQYQAKSTKPQVTQKNDKKDGTLKKTGKVLKTVGKYGKKLAKGGAVAGLGAAAMAVPVVALHMGEQKEIKTFDDIRKNG